MPVGGGGGGGGGWMNGGGVGRGSSSHNAHGYMGVRVCFCGLCQGVFEKGPFAAGTLSVMVDLVMATRRGATTIIGGGDTGNASNRFFFHTGKRGGVAESRACVDRMHGLRVG